MSWSEKLAVNRIFVLFVTLKFHCSGQVIFHFHFFCNISNNGDSIDRRKRKAAVLK